MKRTYSDLTLKILFALSGNQCAHPECTSNIIEPATEKSDVFVTAHICHIYAISTEGPRGKLGFTQKELNSQDNLILLCRNHHAVVDGQHETYPAEVLKDWKQLHESNMQKRLSADLKNVQPDIFSYPYFPIVLVDQKIKDEVGLLRKSRFFVEYHIVRSSLALARKLIEGELSGGTDAVRGWALAWCARFLVHTEEVGKSEDFIKLAKGFGSCIEIDITEAFISSQKGNKNAALSALASLNSPISRSAALMVVSHHEDAEKTIVWLKTAGIKTVDMDSEGKYFLLIQQLKLANWDAMRDTVNVLTDQDLEESPVLYHMMAMTHLLSTVPTELRASVLNQLPFESLSFPLAADASAINTRRIAQRHFTESAVVSRQLNCHNAATADDEYALWLELRDPENSDKGRQSLENKLRDPKSALRLVRLGFQFGIKLDLISVEQEIERQIALNGGITQDAAIARFALAFIQKTPDDVAKYIARYNEELSKYFDKKSLLFLQIEMLSRAGFPEKANEYLQFLLNEELSEDEERHLRSIIAEAEGTDPVETWMVQFKQTDSLGDLLILVDKLESKEDWDNLCVYGEILFERTRSVHDAERLARALSNAEMTEKFVKFYKLNPEILDQSKGMQLFYCWSLYNEGALIEARSEILKLSDDLKNTNYRALQVNLGIALGDWPSLSAFVANEVLEKNNRSAQEIISAAQLAFHLDSPHAKELVFAAAAKGKDDAGVLSAAYFLATNAGWEDDAKVFQWIHKAASLSDDDGPIQQMTIKEILDRKPDWDRRESETWQLLKSGEIPMFLAAESLNKSLINLMLFPALTNLTKRDPGYRSSISAYSGKHQPNSFDKTKTVGIEATALLTLGFLNILDKAFDAFDEVHVPHSTLAWLFEEKQKTAFHQPSRIKRAHQVRNLIATEFLEKFVSSTVPDSDLSTQVGDELAALIAEAEKPGDENDVQRIVVRSSPVHRIASLMEEEADLTEHAAVMSSCLRVVEKLRQKGQITTEEEKRARAYLQLHEKPWPQQPEITDGAILYLDDLTMNYFLHLGVLGKLQAAGFRPIVSPREVSEVNELISYESISGKVEEVIERIRYAVSSRIHSGKIKVGRRLKIDRIEEQSISEHPTTGVFFLVTDCDAIISDDRFLNQHADINDGYAQAMIFSTLDLLDILASHGSITSDNRLEYRTLLRRAGYLFIFLRDDELLIHLTASTVKDDKVVETAELKAIREDILRIRMSKWLQLPKEVLWLDMTLKVFIGVLKGLWKAEADLFSVTAYSNWILDQIDIRGWAHGFTAEIGDNIVKTGRGVFTIMLFTPLSNVPQYVKDAYWNWVEDRVLIPIKEQYPELYVWIVEWQRSQISEIADEKLVDGNIIVNTPFVRSAIALATLNLTPPLIRKSLLEKQELREEYGISANAVLAFNESDVSVKRSDLYDAIRKVHFGVSEIRLTDSDGRDWRLKIQKTEKELPFLAISRNNQYLIIPDFVEFSPDRTIRLHSLDKVVSDVNLPIIARDTWYSILTERSFNDDEMDEFQSDFQDTPLHIARSIREEVSSGQSSVSSLVPHSRRYFERLVGCYDGSKSIKDYAAGQGKQHFERLSAWIPYEGFLLSLYLSLHSELTAEIAVEHLGSEDFIRALNFLEKHGDIISQLGAIEIGLRVLPARPEIEPAITRLIKQFQDDDVNSSISGFKLLSALFVLVDGELSRIRLFSAEPPFYRRLASLSQAALIHRQLVNSDVDSEQFFKWAISTRSEQFYFQSLADMRLEPRWNPEFASSSQLKAEFLGRIINAAKKYEKNINDGELYDLVLGTKPGSLHSLNQSHHLYIPGPLEGAESSSQILSAEFSEMIEKQLDAEEVGPLSFITLVNSALFFRIDTHQVELAARVLKIGSYRLANVEDRSQLLAVLYGLASVAATSRSSSLAKELQILVRRYRNDAQYTLSIEESMRICLIAAASSADLNSWREFVGNWLTELAFGKLEGNDGKVFHSNLKYLCHVVPELWVTCGRADAALEAHNASRNSI